MSSSLEGLHLTLTSFLSVVFSPIHVARFWVWDIISSLEDILSSFLHFWPNGSQWIAFPVNEVPVQNSLCLLLLDHYASTLFLKGSQVVFFGDFNNFFIQGAVCDTQRQTWGCPQKRAAPACLTCRRLRGTEHRLCWWLNWEVLPSAFCFFLLWRNGITQRLSALLFFLFFRFL